MFPNFCFLVIIVYCWLLFSEAARYANSGSNTVKLGTSASHEINKTSANATVTELTTISSTNKTEVFNTYGDSKNFTVAGSLIPAHSLENINEHNLTEFPSPSSTDVFFPVANVQNISQFSVKRRSMVAGRAREIASDESNDANVPDSNITISKNNTTKKKGTKSKIGYFPSQADIKDALTSKHKCSGTLVEDKHVVSSARCVLKSVPKDLAVMAGDVTLLPDRVQTRESRRVQLIAKHPDYVDGEDVQYEFNIAILRLDMPFTRTNYLHPAIIPMTRVANKTLCFLVGWSSEGNKAEETRSYDLYFTDVYTMDMELCYKCVRNAICAGINESKACIGDEGGPLMCGGVLHGIYVGSANNCQSLTGIYTDLVFYKHWIDNIIDWSGNGPMPTPMQFARKRSLKFSQKGLKRNKSENRSSVISAYVAMLVVACYERLWVKYLLR